MRETIPFTTPDTLYIGRIVVRNEVRPVTKPIKEVDITKYLSLFFILENDSFTLKDFFTHEEIF
ncbi:MAG: hypothetical protein B6U76_12015 [Desulfurococcales archaeon ex4484_217_2]|nr:MAG: hypothetical protein B6U76_12015 [Desulfurococcales archaeon ex4484_217_2]